MIATPLHENVNQRLEQNPYAQHNKEKTAQKKQQQSTIVHELRG